MEIILKAYVPISDNTWIDSIDQDHVYAIKFHGNPVNIFPRKNSNIEKTKEKSKTKKMLFSQ